MPPLRFPLNAEKAAQAAAHLLRTHAEPTTRFFLLKWLYLADRTSLIRRGQPITGDTPFCMPNGPVLSSILNFLNETHGAPPTVWSSNVRRIGEKEYGAADSASTDLLAPAEADILDEVHAEHGGKSYQELWDFVHALPEYQAPTAPSRRTSLDLRIVLRAAKIPEEHIEQIAQDAAAQRFFRQRED